MCDYCRRLEGHDYYAMLGIPPTASAREIRAAFRRLALLFHPDQTSATDASDFMRVREAYDVLGNVERKWKYDGVDQHNKILSKHIMMPLTKTYAQGVHALQDACIRENNLEHPRHTCADGTVRYRPLTFRENIIARLTEFNTLTNPDGSPRPLEDRLVLLREFNDSCTGFLRRAQTTKFKIVPIFEPFITIERGYANSWLPVSYDAFDVPELDSNNGIYCRPLSLENFYNNEGWRFAMEHDLSTLHEYATSFAKARILVDQYIHRLAGSVRDSKEFMGFDLYPTTNTLQQDIAKAGLAYHIGHTFLAAGDTFLDRGSFVRRRPVVTHSHRQIEG